METDNERLIRRRQEAYKAVESIYAARQSTNRLPVILGEIKAYTGLNNRNAFSAVRWLVNKGVLLRVPGGYRPNQFKASELCWIHGLQRRETKECPVCTRRNKRRK